MSALRQACDIDRVRHARMPERTVVSRAADQLASVPTGARREAEPWEAMLARLDLSAPEDIRPRDMRRLLGDMWVEAGCDHHEQQLLSEAVRRDRMSMDRAILHSYLLRFPLAHYGFDALLWAAQLVAKRREWPWRTRGDDFALWDKDVGPSRLATALLDTARPSEVLRAAGLDGDLATGAFVRHAIRAACAVAATRRGADAVTSGERLMALASEVKGADAIDALLALALLAPWVGTTPPADHQQRITALLVSRIGDPRLAPARWTALAAELRSEGLDVSTNAAFAVLRRWLVQATVRQFFAIVAKTTDRRDQWRERTDFWLGYLEAGHINEAWFAFGSQAEREARRFMKDQGMAFARIEGQGASASQSALLLTIGDVRIAEWSDNGSCRFWPANKPKAPPMYQSVYYGLVLRTMDAERGYEPLPHMGGTWQNRFARRIYDRTGIAHPLHGHGW
ncbi:EH signature domain-containing protein [Sphingomonas sp.]|uniref:EH signature domain-containing protein n=1 Tax=Sphingomonas sp. TaxID=28214 RepID=UPI0035C845F7